MNCSLRNNVGEILYYVLKEMSKGKIKKIKLKGK